MRPYETMSLGMGPLWPTDYITESVSTVRHGDVAQNQGVGQSDCAVYGWAVKARPMSQSG